MSESNTRTERDFLGERQVPKDALYGIHTLRALENFPLSHRRCHAELISAYGEVKLAAITAATKVGMWKETPQVQDALIRACGEVSSNQLDEWIVVDALQGGAGTSLNMNINEVIANRALQLLGKEPGEYETISPLDDVNCFQSTNDTYPTALKIAAIKLIRQLEEELVRLQESFQAKEKEFSHIVKIGRTQFQDAVLTTLGREMSTFAEAINRDRWRVYKCEERLRVINFGGTAIGTGLNAPRQYIFTASEVLRENTGIGLARAENLQEATSNNDVFVEVSGILKACAASLWKISSDIRFLSSGPQAGIGEISIPFRQAGSSIMPGKANPVIPEMVTQAAMKAFSNDSAIAMACANGHLELNPFLPLIADCLLDSIKLLKNACHTFATLCVDGMKANEEACVRQIHTSTATVTAVVPVIGYAKGAELAQKSVTSGKSIRELVVEEGLLTADEFDEMITPEAVCRLGSPNITMNTNTPKAQTDIDSVADDSARDS